MVVKKEEVVDEEEKAKLRLKLEEELASLDLKPKPKPVAKDAQEKKKETTAVPTNVKGKYNVFNPVNILYRQGPNVTYPEAEVEKPKNSVNVIETVAITETPAETIDTKISAEMSGSTEQKMPPEIFKDPFFLSPKDFLSSIRSSKTTSSSQDEVLSSATDSAIVTSLEKSDQNKSAQTSIEESTEAERSKPRESSKEELPPVHHEQVTYSSYSTISTPSEEESHILQEQKVKKKKTPSPVKDPLRYASLHGTKSSAQEPSVEDVVAEMAKIPFSSSLEIESK